MGMELGLLIKLFSLAKNFPSIQLSIYLINTSTFDDFTISIPRVPSDGDDDDDIAQEAMVIEETPTNNAITEGVIKSEFLSVSFMIESGRFPFAIQSIPLDGVVEK